MFKDFIFLNIPMILIVQPTCIIQGQPDLQNDRKQTMIPTLSDTGIDYSQVRLPICLYFIWLYLSMNYLIFGKYVWSLKNKMRAFLDANEFSSSRFHDHMAAILLQFRLPPSLSHWIPVFAIQNIQLWKTNYCFNILWTSKSIKKNLNLNFSFEIHERCFEHSKMVFRNSQNTSHVIISFQWI